MRVWVAVLMMCAGMAVAQQPVSVPTAPAVTDKEQSFRDTHFGVGFKVPPGWSFTRKDHEVSTFRLDARTAREKSEMRAVVALEFNPFPMSTLAGAMFYYSVEKHARASECVKQASGDGEIQDTLDIGGMNFVHGHDEHGAVCVEARDEVYTAYRKGSCFRFDLELNTFCAVSSGAMELTDPQIDDIEARMAGILSTVKLDWSKAGPHPVAPPERRKLPTPDSSAGTKLPTESGGN